MEKTKLFKLPKAFATKWVEALRSGKYNQTEGQLVSSAETELTFENTAFCCLGVAGVVCGYTLSELDSFGFLFGDNYPKVPQEIQNGPDHRTLVQVLSEMNDGLSNREKDAYGDLGYIFRPLKVVEHNKFSFNQIADFIEDNCEFYEVEENKQK